MSVNDARWNDVSSLMKNRQWNQALDLIEKLHIEYHTNALTHLKIHYLWFVIAIKKLDQQMMIGQILPMMFAIPVSLVHKHFSIAVKKHQG